MLRTVYFYHFTNLLLQNYKSLFFFIKTFLYKFLPPKDIPMNCHYDVTDSHKSHSRNSDRKMIYLIRETMTLKWPLRRDSTAKLNWPISQSLARHPKLGFIYFTLSHNQHYVPGKRKVRFAFESQGFHICIDFE